MKERLGEILTWFRKYVLPAKVIFIFTGLISTLWFLIRVIPKPIRATYPCMRMAAPLMSGFVVYLLSLGGIALLIRKARSNFLRSSYLRSGLFVIAALVVLAVYVGRNSQFSQAADLSKSGPDDGPNQAIGTGVGINPGRVVWVWDPKASNENCVNIYELPKPQNTNQGIVNRMVVNGIKSLGAKESLSDSWAAIFRSFNQSKSGENKSYTPGEKIFIKINQGTALNTLRKIDGERGFCVPERITQSKGAMEGKYGATETFPAVALEILRELVYVVGVDERDIAIGDPIGHIYHYNYEAWSNEFPNVVYIDKQTTAQGRTLISPTSRELIHYSDKSQSDKLYDVIENADYMINLANFKPHSTAGVSFTAKNHFGSQARKNAIHLHYSLPAPVSVGKATNGGYGKYRAQVDLMGSKYLGRNTLLYLVDGIYGGGSVETRVPVKYFMPPFNNDWSNSIFLSQDQVALESVCYDFLRTEWNGTYAHNPANNNYESMANSHGVDDYLHQAADSSTWPEGIIYDPDNTGYAMASLGTHEHWNNAAKKQYSRNLGLSRGIELISVPDTLVGGDGPEISTPEMWLVSTMGSDKKQEEEAEETESKSSTNPGSEESEQLEVRSVITLPFGGAFQATEFYSLVVDHQNTKWFLCDAGLVSLEGEEWKLHNDNRKIPAQEAGSMAYDSSDFGMELWFTSGLGATVAEIPIDGRSGATTYYAENSDIVSENVVSVSVGKGSLRWFGTDKGISAFYEDYWLTPSYQRKYPEYMFEDFPITDMATNPGGDSLYIATMGAGVSRVYRNEVDGISGASEYAPWGSILIPSDNVTCIFIEPDGTQWFGTDAGVARHRGKNTLDNWLALDKDDGLVDNEVTCITIDHQERVWIGTKAGISVFEDNKLKTFGGGKVNCIAVDREGIVWIGTSRGVRSYYKGDITTYLN